MGSRCSASFTILQRRRRQNPMKLHFAGVIMKCNQNNLITKRKKTFITSTALLLSHRKQPPYNQVVEAEKNAQPNNMPTLLRKNSQLMLHVILETTRKKSIAQSRRPSPSIGQPAASEFQFFNRYEQFSYIETINHKTFSYDVSYLNLYL